MRPLHRDENAALRAEYRELNANMRSYGNQRFQHLSLFSAATAGLIFLAIEAERDHGDRKFLPGAYPDALVGIVLLGLVVSTYFVFMERRAADHWYSFRDRAVIVEAALADTIRQWHDHLPARRDTPAVPIAGKSVPLNATTVTTAFGVAGAVSWIWFGMWHLRAESPALVISGVAIPVFLGLWLIRRLAGETLGSERLVLARDPWLRVYETKVTLPNGQVLDPFYMVKAPEYVIVVATTAEGRVVMERAYKHANGGISLELPTGGIDRGESAVRCASRELGDETGYVSPNSDEDWQDIGTFVVDGNRGFGTAHVMRVEGVSYQDGRLIDDPKEPIEEVILLSREDACSALQDGRVRTLHTFAALSWFCGEHSPARNSG